MTCDHLKMASNTELDHEVEETEEAGPDVMIVESVNGKVRRVQYGFTLKRQGKGVDLRVRFSAWLIVRNVGKALKFQVGVTMP